MFSSAFCTGFNRCYLPHAGWLLALTPPTHPSIYSFPLTPGKTKIKLLFVMPTCHISSLCFLSHLFKIIIYSRQRLSGFSVFVNYVTDDTQTEDGPSGTSKWTLALLDEVINASLSHFCQRSLSSWSKGRYKLALKPSLTSQLRVITGTASNCLYKFLCQAEHCKNQGKTIKMFIHIFLTNFLTCSPPFIRIKMLFLCWHIRHFRGICTECIVQLLSKHFPSFFISLKGGAVGTIEISVQQQESFCCVSASTVSKSRTI